MHGRCRTADHFSFFFLLRIINWIVGPAANQSNCPSHCHLKLRPIYRPIFIFRPVPLLIRSFAPCKTRCSQRRDVAIRRRSFGFSSVSFNLSATNDANGARWLVIHRSESFVRGYCPEQFPGAIMRRVARHIARRKHSNPDHPPPWRRFTPLNLSNATSVLFRGHFIEFLP